MSIRFDTVKVGDVLLDVHRERMGNTMMSRTGVWEVRVLEVRPTGATVSWNGNRPSVFSRFQVERLRRFAPEWLRAGFAEGFRCHHCRATSATKDSADHRPSCPHPKAVAHRRAALRAEAAR